MPFDTNNLFPDCRRVIAKPALVLLVSSVVCFSGCATPRQTYVSQHPELTAEHRKIIVAGQLADRDPVAGMTRQEIRLTMGVDPTQTTTINGEDVWVWVKRKGDSMTLLDDTTHSGSSGTGSFSGVPRGSDPDAVPKKRVQIRTTVFFKGNLATRVDVTEEPLEKL